MGARPNRRTLSQGSWLPSRTGHELGDVALLVDTSKSIHDEQLALVAEFLEGVLSANPGKLWIIYHTVEIYHVEE